MTPGEIAVVTLAAIPVALHAMNFWVFSRLPEAPDHGTVPASVLIPARNEAANVEALLQHVLASTGVDLEVLVYDDGSTDETASLVRRVADADDRVRLLEGTPLPAGWNGKQHACQRLAEAATHPILVFLDADVRPEPSAVARMAHAVGRGPAPLVSAFPRQITGSWLERLTIPLMTFILLGYLPMLRMRRTTKPAYAAGCGQWMAARRTEYAQVGGHGAIRESRHDGIRLPRAFRNAGFLTHVFDGSSLARCRMYHGARATWHGLRKNAGEAIAGPVAIFPWTLLLLGGQVAPALLLLHPGTRTLPMAAAALSGPLLRIVAALRYRQSLAGALLHPVGVLVFLTSQWQAWLENRRGVHVPWKGRP